MATRNVSSDNLSCNTLTRRAALSGAAACTVLPVAAAAAEPFPFGRDLAVGRDVRTDPLVGLWAELVEIRADADADGWTDELTRRECELEDLIAATPPITPEGAAIVATMIVEGHRRMYPDGADYIEVEDKAGDTLAQYVLAQMPADVLRRAGLEG